MAHIDIKKLPSIRNNSFYHECGAMVEANEPSRCSYAVCQHTIVVFQKGKLKGFETCRKAISTRQCPAVNMMMEEIKAKTPIYFVDAAQQLQSLIDEREARAERLRLERERKPAKKAVTVSVEDVPTPAKAMAKPIADIYSALIEAETPQ